MKKKKDLHYNYVFLFYDVSQKRVHKVFKICKKYLNHWQNSVFRGAISNAQILKLENEIKEIIDEEQDFISIVKLVDFKYIDEVNIGIIERNTEDIFI